MTPTDMICCGLGDLYGFRLARDQRLPRAEGPDLT